MQKEKPQVEADAETTIIEDGNGGVVIYTDLFLRFCFSHVGFCDDIPDGRSLFDFLLFLSCLEPGK